MKPPAITPEASYPVLPRHGACLICRGRKMKCDATKPECLECVAMGRKCRYEDDTYRSRTQQLQDRIKDLEAKIRAAEEQGSSLSSNLGSSSSSGGHHTSSPDTSTRSHISGISPPTLSSGDSLSPGNSLSPFPGSPSPVGSALELSGQPGLATGPELSPELTKKLLEIFIIRQSQCAFELHMDRIIASLQPGAPEPVVPALLNAMLLMACHFAEDVSVKSYESTFLDRTKKEIEDNIDKALGGKGKYNGVHHLQAMCMLGYYYYVKGRLLEGHFHCSNAARFAVALGLHQISSRIYRPDSMVNKAKRAFGQSRWRPRDPVELGEAINVWWICGTLDYGGSVMSGLLPSVPREEITTVWPRMLVDFESGQLPDDNYSVAALLDPLLNWDIANASGDNVKSTLAKAGMLMAYAAQLDTERLANPAGSEEWWKRFENCDNAVIRLMQTLPPVQLARDVEELAYIVLIHTSTYCANVQLHSTLAEYEIAMGAQGDPRGIQPDGSLGGLSHARCTEACRATALVATLVADIDLQYMYMFIGLAWVCVAQVLTREVPRLRKSGHLEQANEKERQLAIMERSMERLVATYPVLDLQVQQLRALKTW